MVKTRAPARPSYPKKPSMSFFSNFFSFTSRRLWHAAQSGDINAVQQLIMAGADVNSSNGWTDYRKTPLMLAAEQGHTEVVR
ncbi:MAG: ankyrin repeat domain-containing protein, partial [Ottowia sp.]|nr:ankyrin repeat domain-containing protein [Ottowia sp.]